MSTEKSAEKQYLYLFSAVLVFLALFHANTYAGDFKIGFPLGLGFFLWVILIANALILNGVANRWFVLVADLMGLIFFFSFLLNVEESLSDTSRSSSIALAYLLLLLAVFFQIVALLFGKRITEKIFQ